MFGRKKDPKKERKPRAPGSLAQYGIFEVPESLGDLGGSMDDNDLNDEDLEAELAALTAGDQPRRPAPKKPPPKPTVNLDKMINDSLKDIHSDEELSGDDDDPELLNELNALTGNPVEEDNSPINKPDHSTDVTNEITTLLEERLKMYKIAETRAKSANESSKAKRFGRGVKTLEQLLVSSKLGHQIDTEDIPPILPPSAYKEVEPAKPATEELKRSPEPNITTPDSNTTPTEDLPSETPSHLQKNSPVEPSSEPQEVPPVKVDEDTLSILKNRQKEYKIAALAWKKAANQEEAVKCIKISKQFEIVISALLNGETIDLSDMPPMPTMPSATTISDAPLEDNKEESGNQQSSAADQPRVPVSIPQPSSKVESLEGALKERLEVYRRSKTVAETEGNSSKVRRYGRICKQFEDALKLHGRGKAIPIDELPTPPGFPPLSDIIRPTSVTSDPSPSLRPTPTGVDTEPEQNTKSETPIPVSPMEPKVPSDTPQPSRPAPVAPPRSNSDKKKKLTTHADKQLEVLQQRQKELKIAALKAKKDGDLELARDYLRQAKGIDPLIEASLSGLPVAMNSIPLSPQAKLQLEEQNLDDLNISNDGFTMISSMDCSEATGDDAQIYENLEAQLKKQIKWCMATRDHCKAIGDVASYNKWGRMALDYAKDLDMLRVRKRDNLPAPQHHYELRTYAIVQSCTDLTDADMEISIIRGTNYTKETDTYVFFEIPLPVDSSTSDKTSTIRDTKNPEYNAVFPLTGVIDRKSRQCQRLFKRHSLKCQVWTKGGIFRAASLVGTVTIKLQPLETQCILHDSFPLMDGRKAVGGKLEVKIRLRNPIATKQIEQNKDKWLVIDN